MGSNEQNALCPVQLWDLPESSKEVIRRAVLEAQDSASSLLKKWACPEIVGFFCILSFSSREVQCKEDVQLEKTQLVSCFAQHCAAHV